jgi:glutathione S-transferase
VEGNEISVFDREDFEMLTLFSYPELYGVTDNNPYGLKVFAFLKLCHLTFEHKHIFDASQAPHAQLPYLVDKDSVIGDSDAIISHLIKRYDLSIDSGLTSGQRDTGLLVKRLLDDLYWVMSYSRWKDPSFWPLFRDAILRTHPNVTPTALESAREYNFKRYYYQGIGRYEPDMVYARGVADLEVLGNLLPESGFLFGAAPSSVDAGMYGFIANMYYFGIETPLKTFLLSRQNVVTHCCSIQAMLGV